MRNLKHLKCAVVAWMCLITPGLATAANYYVHAGPGKNSNSGKQPGSAWADLAYALPKLAAGDTLHIRTGTYKSLHKIGKLKNGTETNPITIKPYQNEKPVISSSQRFWLSNNRWWVLDNLTFQNNDEMTLGNQSTVGNCSSYASNIVIKNSRFQHSSENGITLRCVKNVVIVGNTFDNLRSRQEGLDRNAIKLVSNVDGALIWGNHFRDIGADGVQMDHHVYKNISIVGNTFEVVRPYRYRDVNGKVVSQSGSQKFGNVGENAIDIKGGPGPIDIQNNVFKGFRAKVSGQDASGSMGPAVIIHNDSSGINFRNNTFSDNVFHIRLVGDRAPVAKPDRNVEISYNNFEDVIQHPGSGQTPTGLYVHNVSNVRIFHNNFYSLDGSGKRLLSTSALRDVTMHNNLFYNGKVETSGSTSNIRVDSSHNAWSKITKVPSVLAGPNDVKPNDPGVAWSSGDLKASSPLVDAGMYVSGHQYDGTVSGSAPDIGSKERGSDGGSWVPPEEPVQPPPPPVEEPTPPVEEPTSPPAAPGPASEVVYRINTGGSSYMDSTGNTWSADKHFNTGSKSVAKSATITGTNDPELYKSARWDKSAAPDLLYKLPVSNGSYTVRLHFSETNSKNASAGARLFDIYIEGWAVLMAYDIFAEVGFYKADVKEFNNVTVYDGDIDIEFQRIVKSPRISAIEVIRE